jgi:hypothetical protein
MIDKMIGLYIFVEGDRDEVFFERIVKPRLVDRYNNIIVVKYAQKGIEYIKSYIRSILSMNADYIFIADIDNSPCKTAKKEELRRRFPNLEQNKIIIVVKEIESWYLAGLDREACEELGIECFDNTDSITKEDFKHIYSNSIHSRRPEIDFYLNIIENYDIDIAKRKNRTFRYFCDKFSI